MSEAKRMSTLQQFNAKLIEDQWVDDAEGAEFLEQLMMENTGMMFLNGEPITYQYLPDDYIPMRERKDWLYGDGGSEDE